MNLLINSSKFHKEFTFEKRKEESNRVLMKYPNRVPVIVQLLKNSTLSNINKIKYLVPIDLTMGQFIYVVRKRIAIKEEQSIFLYINNKIIQSSSLFSQLHKEQKEPDGFLYVYITSESVFGNNV